MGNGDVIEDFNTLSETAKTFSKRHVNPSQLIAAAELAPGDLVIRVASNAAVPALPAGVRYAQIDVRGEAIKHLDEIPMDSIVLPGAAEACLKLLKNCLAKEGANLLDHVNSFLPPNKPHRRSDAPRSSSTPADEAPEGDN